MSTPADDSWMDDPEKNAEFERILADLDEKLRPVTDAMRASEHLTEKDFAIVINARDE